MSRTYFCLSFLKMLLKKCIQNKRTGFVQKIRAIAILFILLTALISSIEVLFIRPFYEPYIGIIEKTRYVLIFIALFTLVTGMLIGQISLKKEIEKLILEPKK